MRQRLAGVRGVGQIFPIHFHFMGEPYNDVAIGREQIAKFSRHAMYFFTSLAMFAITRLARSFSIFLMARS